MLTWSILVVMLPLSDDSLVPRQMLEKSGFRVRSVHIEYGYAGRAECERKSDGARLDVWFQSETANVGKKLIDPTRSEEPVMSFMPQSAEGMTTELPSKHSLGTDFFWRVVPNMRQVLAMTEYERIAVSWNGAWKKDPEGIERQLRVDESVSPFIEKVARVILARLVAKRVDAIKSKQLNGRTVAIATNQTKGVDLIDIRDWAAARGWTSQAKEHESITLAKGSHTIVVPLASASIQVDGKWVELPDAIAEKEGRWLVPLESLERVKS